MKISRYNIHMTYRKSQDLIKLSLVAAAALLLALAHIAQAAESGSVASPQNQKPVLSKLGRKRINENLGILKQNLRDLDENLRATQKNLNTLKIELKDLDGLEKDHLELKKKYLNYLEFAQKEMEKNKKLLGEIQEWENNQTAGESDERELAKETSIKTEKADRIKWQEDYDEKVKKISALIKGVTQNIKEINLRREPVREQLSVWNEREAQYTKLLEETQKKKIALENLLHN